MASPMWVAIGAIAICAIIGKTLVKIITASNSGGKFSTRVDDLEEQVNDLADELTDARQRIEVLEKIVTDQKYDLGRQIDDLAAGT